MKRMLSSLNLFGLSRKRQKLDTTKNEEKDDTEKSDAPGALRSYNRRHAHSQSKKHDFAKSSTIPHHRDLIRNGEKPRMPGNWSSQSSDEESEDDDRRARSQEDDQSTSTSDADTSPSAATSSTRNARPTGSRRTALDTIQDLTGYEFVDISLLEEAFYIGKPAFIGRRFVFEGNLRLACVGDKALALVWWDAWYSRPESRRVGSDRFQRASTNRELAAVGFFHCLDDFVMNEKGYMRQDLGVKKMADTVEAIIGAIWLDSNKDFKAIKEAIVGLLGRRRVDSAYAPR